MSNLRMIRKTKKAKGASYDVRRRGQPKGRATDYVHAALRRDVHVELVLYLEDESPEALTLRDVTTIAVREWLERQRS